MEAIEQEIRDQVEGAAQKVLLPQVRRLDELFERIDVVTDLHGYTSGRAKEWSFEEKDIGGRTVKAEAWLSTFCSVRGTPFNLDVQPTPETVKLVERTMMICGGYVINFGITVRAGGECALVEAHYNMISGSRWFAIVDADHIRALVPKEGT